MKQKTQEPKTTSTYPRGELTIEVIRPSDCFGHAVRIGYINGNKTFAAKPIEFVEVPMGERIPAAMLLEDDEMEQLRRGFRESGQPLIVEPTDGDRIVSMMHEIDYLRTENKRLVDAICIVGARK